MKYTLTAVSQRITEALVRGDPYPRQRRLANIFSRWLLSMSKEGDFPHVLMDPLVFHIAPIASDPEQSLALSSAGIYTNW